MDTIENDIIKDIKENPSIKKVEKSYGTIKLTYKSGITSYIQINLEDNLDTMAKGGGKEYQYYVPEKYDQTIEKKYQMLQTSFCTNVYYIPHKNLVECVKKCL